MKTLNRVNDILFTIEKWISMIGFIGMVGIVLYSIIRREFIQVPFSAGEEITRNLTVIVIFISAAMAVKCQSHVGVEAVANAIPEKYQKQAWYFRNFIELILWILIAIYASKVMLHYVGSGQVTPISRVPIYVVYVCVPVCGFLAVYHMIVRILNKIEEGL